MFTCWILQYTKILVSSWKMNALDLFRLKVKATVGMLILVTSSLMLILMSQLTQIPVLDILKNGFYKGTRFVSSTHLSRN